MTTTERAGTVGANWETELRRYETVVRQPLRVGRPATQPGHQAPARQGSTEEAMTDQPEAHPVRVEYAIERALGDGRWVVDSISYEPTPEEALAEAGWFMDERPHATYRTVRRTITTTVVAVHPAKQPGEHQ